MGDGLDAVLLRARERGFLGPGDPASHRVHALAFAEAYEALEGGPPSACCDLGSGGGMPGLVLATRWPGTSVSLLEASARRCDFLREAIGALGVGATTSVCEGRAEALARTPGLEGRFGLVTARSFGRPGVTAECAARLLEPGGVLLVGEPPSGEVADRWPTTELAVLGLGTAVMVSLAPHLVAIRRVGRCPDRYPRRNGVPSKRPLF